MVRRMLMLSGVVALVAGLVAAAGSTRPTFGQESTPDLPATVAALTTKTDELQTAVAGLATEVADLQATVNAGSVAATTSPPTPTPLPQAGAVLYEADASGGLDTWELTGGWVHFQGMLANDGSGGTLAIPYDTDLANYAVEVEAQYFVGERRDALRITVRDSAVTAVAQFFHGGVFFYIDNDLIDSLSQEDINSSPEDWVTYRFEIEDNRLRFFVDGTLLLQTTDNRLISIPGGPAGVGASNVQMNIRRVRILAL